MRATLCGVALAMMVGCGKQDQPAPNVVIGQEVGGGLPGFPPTARKSMVTVDYPALWKQHGRKEPDALAQARRHVGLMSYGRLSDAYLSAAVVGSGMAGPIAGAIRVQAQPEVVKLAKAASDAPLVIASSHSGAMFDQSSTGFVAGGNRKLILGVGGTREELDHAFFGFGEAVLGVVREMGGQLVSRKAGNTPYPHSEFTYAIGDRSGTFAARLLLPDAGADVIDVLFPPADDLARTMLKTRRKDQSLLVVTVEEK